KLEVDLRGTFSIGEVQQRMRGRLKEFEPGEWIIAPGWDHTLWSVKKFPNRRDLDAISTDHPIFSERVDGHVAVVNSRALKTAGITRETPDPPGGHIERDPTTGDPTGMLEEDSAKNRVYERDSAGFQIALHAIGDRANQIALNAFAAAEKANGPLERRDRVEHAQVVAPGDFVRFTSLDVVASMQPSHLLDDERWATDRLGPERVKGGYAWHTMEKDGVRLAFGTDYPVESINPLRGIYACLTRELPGGGPQGGWQPQEKLP